MNKLQCATMCSKDPP
ncbi:hypothetical protein Zm00014a_028069 [Zea mays]|uniref:Uncharacterized protein n=1 Tax=Zea mays TaxID=4577 RepID=A0A3L6EFU5_MAIZE|nr:hypothetical protein Zm00014a_028069 [Zea mays]